MTNKKSQSGRREGGEAAYLRVIGEGLPSRWHLGQGWDYKKEPYLKVCGGNTPGTANGLGTSPEAGMSLVSEDPVERRPGSELAWGSRVRTHVLPFSLNVCFLSCEMGSTIAT